MTEHERAERFTRDVDALLRGETPASDDQALLDLSRDLLAADFSAETRLDLLRPRPAKPTWKGIIMSPRYRYVRWFVTSAALFTLIVAIILTVPPLRAIAQDILRQIGIMKVTDGPTDYERAQQPIPALNLARASGEWHSVSEEEIETNANWRAVFETIPTGFDRLEYGRMADYELELGFFGFRLYRSGETEPALSLKELYRLLPYGPIDYETGGAQTELVDINGIQGTWVSGFSEHPEIDIQLLIWEVDWDRPAGDELILILQSRDATKTEMLEIARAMTIRTPDSIPPSRGPFIPSARTPQQVALQLGFDVAVLPTAQTHIPPNIFHIYQGEDFAQVDSATPQLVMQQVKVYDASLVNQDIWQYDVGNTPVEDVEVNGNAGVWIEGLPSFLESTRNILLWEQDGFSFALSSDGVSKEAMIEAAESITFVGPGQPEERPASPRKLLPAAIVAGQTGFAIAEPEYVPEGYRLIARDSKRGSDVIGAITVYEHEDGDALVLHQGEYPESVTPRDLALSDSRLIDVTVSGSPAIWLADYGTYPDSQVGMLVWEQDSSIFRLQSALLGRDEMIRIAESLTFSGASNR